MLKHTTSLSRGRYFGAGYILADDTFPLTCLMSHLGQLLNLIEEVLECCRRYFSTENYETTDTTLFYLHGCSSLLSAYLSSILYDSSLVADSAGSEVAQLLDLHRCIDQLIITWGTKLLRIEGGTTTIETERGGRPQKTINIELVRVG